MLGSWRAKPACYADLSIASPGPQLVGQLEGTSDAYDAYGFHAHIAVKAADDPAEMIARGIHVLSQFFDDLKAMP